MITKRKFRIAILRQSSRDGQSQSYAAGSGLTGSEANKGFENLFELFRWNAGTEVANANLNFTAFHDGGDLGRPAMIERIVNQIRQAALQ
jgi:hypothetical protein